MRILKNETTGEREGRDGRIRVGKRVEWFVVEASNGTGNLVATFRTRKDAEAFVARHEAEHKPSGPSRKTRPMAKHTKGPWKMVADCAVMSSDNVAVADCRTVDTTAVERKANARLIAATPDLLEACRALVEFWDNGTPVHPGAEVVADLRAAIAKATEP